jgi:hypothetical protein
MTFKEGARFASDEASIGARPFSVKSRRHMWCGRCLLEPGCPLHIIVGRTPAVLGWTRTCLTA